MAEKIGWTYSVQALGGPSVTGSGSMLVDSYVKLSVVVPKQKTLDVEIQPGAGSSLQILLIQPVTPSPDLSYKSGADTVVLDGPHVLIGSGAVNLLAVSVGKLTFDNKSDVDAGISILAGRDATPP